MKASKARFKYKLGDLVVCKEGFGKNFHYVVGWLAKREYSYINSCAYYNIQWSDRNELEHPCEEADIQEVRDLYFSIKRKIRAGKPLYETKTL